MAYKAEERPLPEELLEDPWFSPGAGGGAAALVGAP